MKSVLAVNKQLQCTLQGQSNLPSRFRASKKKVLPSDKSQFVFAQFDIIYDRLWESKGFKNDLERDAYVLEWNEALKPISQLELEAVCNKLSLLPQDELPHIISAQRFLGYCRALQPEELGFPNFRFAYDECYKYTKNAHKYSGQRWSHPLIFAASMELYDKDRLSVGHQHSEYSLFKRVYMRHIRRFLAGKVYDQPPLVKPFLKRRAEQNNQVAASSLQKIRSLIVLAT
ncbi:replication protein P [Piscirickettsia litoralis]|uniref:Uncharacterized protein n=1 Tax=Piscirickettsia litoralis TaxID=1891921 RepID=A0ABX2ZYA6_9GAMM|nr:replication protein P [Piscirickettsia litoralis]ODN41364.1 hypothetical protein BGC07_16470 [Piscirickettsia litoralis]